MKEPKTIQGYLNLMKRIEAIQVTTLKGYDDLSYYDKINLGGISAALNDATYDFVDNHNWNNEDKKYKYKP